MPGARGVPQRVLAHGKRRPKSEFDVGPGGYFSDEQIARFADPSNYLVGASAPLCRMAQEVQYWRNKFYEERTGEEQ